MHNVRAENRVKNERKKKREKDEATNCTRKVTTEWGDGCVENRRTTRAGNTLRHHLDKSERTKKEKRESGAFLNVGHVLSCWKGIPPKFGECIYLKARAGIFSERPAFRRRRRGGGGAVLHRPFLNDPSSFDDKITLRVFVSPPWPVRQKN